MGAAVYRVQEVKPADTGYGAMLVNIIPASPAAVDEKLEVGSYIVIHEDNGPGERE